MESAHPPLPQPPVAAKVARPRRRRRLGRRLPAVTFAAAAALGSCTPTVMDVYEYGAQNRNAQVIYNHNGTGRNYTGASGGVSFDTCWWILIQRLDDYKASHACQVNHEWIPGSLGTIDLTHDGTP
jgi:hypothetical protein